MRAALPRCPGLYVDMIVARLAARDPAWTGQPARPRAMLVSDMARAVIRHQLTDYDRLMADHQLSRDEARSAVDAEITDWLAQWGDADRSPDRPSTGRPPTRRPR